MSIFSRVRGPCFVLHGLTNLDRLQNPEKYEYTQQGYDAFSAQCKRNSDARQAADCASQDAIPYGYVGRGSGARTPPLVLPDIVVTPAVVLRVMLI